MYKKKVKKSIECLHLETLYNEHRDYILDLFQTNYIYSDAYVDILCRQFPDIFPSQNEVKKMMYLMNIDKEHWGERTLGKLTHDMDLELTSHKESVPDSMESNKIMGVSEWLWTGI